MEKEQHRSASPACFLRSPFGLYVHVPFCATACDYCAFYHERPRRHDIDAWLAGIEREAEIVPLPRPADTFFIGGGTPGVLTARDFEKLGKILLHANGGAVPAEWSVELAPSTVTVDKLAALRDSGVNRISIGVQSFDAGTLEILGRRQQTEKIFRAYEMVRSAGFCNVNLDLIFAVPGESESRWGKDIETALKLAPEHISTYCLMLEENTPLSKRFAESNGYCLLDKSPEREAKLYLRTWEILSAAGYAQYEIANFSKQNTSAETRCMHNLNTWRMHEWLGYGPAAASQIGMQRFANPSNLTIWLDALTDGVPARTDVVGLTPSSLFADALIFGLRLNEGVKPVKLAERFLGHKSTVPAALSDLFSRLSEEGYLENTPATGTIALNPRGRLVADAIAEAVLEAL